MIIIPLTANQFYYQVARVKSYCTIPGMVHWYGYLLWYRNTSRNTALFRHLISSFPLANSQGKQKAKKGKQTPISTSASNKEESQNFIAFACFVSLCFVALKFRFVSFLYGTTICFLGTVGKPHWSKADNERQATNEKRGTIHRAVLTCSSVHKIFPTKTARIHSSWCVFGIQYYSILYYY